MDNNHVVANSSSTQKPRASKGDPVLQPGVYDKGVFTDWNAQDVIGTLYDYIPIDEVGLNSVDVALVRPFTDYLLERVAYSSIVSTDFTVGKKGSYSGRTSGYKEIQVFDPSVTLQINYGKFIATFTDVVVFTPPPLPGDSGSAITTLKDAGVVEIKDEGNRPWMLLFAGSSIYGIACKISRVLESFSRQGISISFTPPPPPPPPKIAIRDLHVQVNGVRTDTISRNIPFSVVWKIVNEGTTDFDGQWFLQIRKSNGQVWFITSKSIDFSLAAGKEHNIGFMFFGILSTEPIGIWGIDAGVFIESGAIVTWYSIKMNVI